MARRHTSHHRLDRQRGLSLRNWEQPSEHESRKLSANAVLDMGWGRLIFGHTFGDPQALLDTIVNETPGRRDITLYLRDPHVLLAKAPHRVFLDPSHTFRLWSENYQPASHTRPGFRIRRVRTAKDAQEIARIYNCRQMVAPDPDFILEQNTGRKCTFFIAEALDDGAILGTVMGADHVEIFHDPEKGASLWCLAVDGQAPIPGVGEALVRYLCEHFFTRGRSFVDLSVMHDNTSAISLYEKLGFDRVPVFCVKHKNPINEPLYTASQVEEGFNPYAAILIHEARRRGIDVEPIDPEYGYFRLRLGGRSVVCRESLTDQTTAVAMSRCDDKRVTRRLLQQAGLQVPAQITADDDDTNRSFLDKHKAIVVKPAHGEQGRGIHVDLRTHAEMDKAIADARSHDARVLLEQYVAGEDLRVIVINQEVVAAAVRRPPHITGTGQDSVATLIRRYNRRRQAATGGESRIPLDQETRRTLGGQGLDMDSVPPSGKTIKVRKTANVHVGGTIDDVTAQIHDDIRQASLQAAAALDIPVVGLDFLMPDIEGSDYVIIEANERPGLANHEPAPTAQRFMDFLFPQTCGLAHTHKF